MSNRAFGLLVLVALLCSIYVLTSAGKFHIVDEVSLFAVTESIATRGNVDTNAIAWTQWVNSPGEVLGAFAPDGEAYSKKGPAPAVLAVPWYLLLRTLARLHIEIGLLQGTLLWNGLVTALTAGLLWLTVVRLGYRDRTGIVISLLFGLGTIAWPYANHFFGEPLSALSLLLVFYGILSYRVTGRLGWTWLAGVGAAVVVSTVVAHAILLVALGAYGVLSVLTHQPAQEGNPTATIRRILIASIGFLVPLLAAGILLMIYNYLRFGSFFDTGYHFESGEGFTASALQGLWGLLISPYRGVFWHTPLFIAALICFPTFYRQQRTEAIVIVALSLLLIGLYCRWWMWWGGFAWGPRFLVPLTPFWVLALAPTVEQLTRPNPVADATHSASIPIWQRFGISGWVLIGAALLSGAVQLLAVSVNYVNYEIQLRSIFPVDWEDPLRFGPPAQSLADWWYSPVFGQFQLLRENFRDNTDLAWLRADGTTHYVTVLVGLAALITLGLLLINVYRASRADQGASRASLLLVWMIPLIPMTLIGVWLGQVATDPHYGTPTEGYRAVIADLCAQVEPTDAIVTIVPYYYQIPMNWMPSQCTTAPPLYGYAANSMEHLETQQVLLRLLQTSERLWVITGGLPANDPENSIERWLTDVAYEAEDRWFGDYRLVRYATPLRLFQNGVNTRLDISLGTGALPLVTLIATRAPASVPPGAILPIEITYQLEAPIEPDLHWFVQLLAADGYAVALIDTQPMHGYRTFSTLPVGATQIERVALQLELNLAPGTYQLIAGLYDPAVEGGKRLQLPNGKDYIELGAIEVVP